ncbi:universal stress protein [Salirhabdus salicampi]|uniref:universal stress protein n=1 Tax=Salirhabdus salicampi TaxID=476102 RepID=UPI0020C4CF9B|nr:universal stress protein [Salirhabdus salicampi]MCP8615355.1 universal stress protein [Salirhabdus salicampi]
MYKKILLATDGSEHSLRTTEHAIHLAQSTEGSKIEVVYVKDSGSVKANTLNNWNKIGITDVQRDKLTHVETTLGDSNIQFEIKVLTGEPGPTIVNYANKNNFDLVIVGSRGLNGLQELVLGRVSHKVAKRADCPVLIVK